VEQAAFLDNLRQSRLVAADDLERIASRFPLEISTQHLASALVEEGLLTCYQAKQLWAGKPRGLVLGQYRILEELGKGGFGQVFKARHALMNRVVALKVIAPELVADPQVRSMFHREVLASTQLCHPNIVMAYDANEVDDVLFLVMEFVDGPNLDAFVKEQGPLPAGLACELIRQAALALQHAHEKGMVHRDIKPGNLLLPKATSGPTPASGPEVAPPLLKVVDFGLARLHRSASAGNLTLTSDNFLGTPDYVSPEQARNLHAVDIRSDLYSLGCTFYFALTGRRPFRASTAMEVIVKHLESEPEPLEDVRPEVAPEVRDIVRRLMAKNPKQRFQTPAALIEALAPWCEGNGCREPARLRPRAPGPPGEADEQPETAHHATALVPELAFWLGPEQRRPAVTALPHSAATAAVMEKPARPAPTQLFAVKPMEHRGEVAEPAISKPISEPKLEIAPHCHPSAALRKCWRQWLGVVEAFVQGGHPRLDGSAYAALHAALLNYCRPDPSDPGPRPALLKRIEALVEPWLSLRTLAMTDRDTLLSLLARCQTIDQEIGPNRRSMRWLGAPLLVSLVAIGLWYLECTWRLTASVKPWSEQARRVVLARPVLSLGIAGVALVLVGLAALSRLLRK
jgi:serine/threonine protein kinase